MRHAFTTSLILAVLLLAGVAPSVAVPAQAEQEQPVPDLKEITAQKVEDQLHVSIVIEGPFTLETLEVQAPKRLVLDFQSVGKISAAPIFEVNDVGVLSIRTGQFQVDVARVVFDLAEPAPAHSITQMDNGVKVVFWLEAPPPPPAIEEKPVEEKPKEAVKEEEKAEEEEAPAVRSGIFIRPGLGGVLYLTPNLEATTDLFMYAEHGSFNETYGLKPGLFIDLAVGKYFTDTVKVGLGASGQAIYTKATIEANIPHPFIVNRFRTVTVEQDLQQNLWSFYAFGLFSLVRQGKIELSAGPMVGFVTGDYQTLQDMTIEEKSPFESKDITVKDTIFVKNKISSLGLGGLVEFEYSLGKSLNLVLDAKLFYAGPKIEDMDVRVNILSLAVVAGLQYSF